jgi:hypothetical protein
MIAGGFGGTHVRRARASALGEAQSVSSTAWCVFSLATARVIER